MQLPRKKQTDEQTIDEFWDYVEFSRNLGLFNQILTPDLVNQQLKNITLNPLQSTADQIDTALASPKDNESNLIGYGQNFELTDMLYKRQLLYIGNLPSWDLSYVCTNAEDDEDYNSAAYRKDEKIAREFLDKFDYKAEFSTIFRQLTRQESFFGILRDEGDKYIIQELPYQFCKITGKFEYGLLYDLNMYFFIQAGVDINGYPNAIKKKFNQVFGNKKITEYVPSASLDSRTGKYVYYVQTSPEDNFWMWKMTPEIVTQVPFFAAMFPDLVLRPLVRNLQKNRYIQQASKLLVALIGMNKENKSGNVRDQINISPETAGRFINLMRTGINSAITVTGGPWQDVKTVEYDTGTSGSQNILDQYTKVTVGSGGNNTRLLYNSSDKSNALETTNSIAIDEALAIHIYPWFSNFLDYYINKKTKKYKFHFWFEGTTLPASKENRMKEAVDTANLGIVLPHKFSSALGMNPFNFERQLQMARSKKFVDKLTPIISAFQQSSDKGGRPQKSQSKLDDDGLQTRESGSNLARGGDV